MTIGIFHINDGKCPEDSLVIYFKMLVKVNLFDSLLLKECREHIYSEIHLLPLHLLGFIEAFGITRNLYSISVCLATGYTSQPS